MENFYVGDKKILGVTLLEEKTPGGAEMAKVMFEDTASEIMPKARLDLVTSEVKSDATTMGNTIVKAVSSRIYALLHEYGIKFTEVNAIIDGVTGLTNEGFNKASNLMWGIEHIQELTLNQINDVLLKNARTSEKTTGTDDASSTGSGTDTENKE